MTINLLFEESINGCYILFYNDKCVGLKCNSNNTKVIYDSAYRHPISFVHLNIIQTCLQVKNLFIGDIKVAKVTTAKKVH